MRFLTILTLLISLLSCSPTKTLKLNDKVEVLRDKFGINHIYANNQRDLFYMQGYLAARDRLFQFEIWRRQATGTVSEIFGESELERDIGTRLFMFRGDIKEELIPSVRIGRSIEIPMWWVNKNYNEPNDQEDKSN